MYTVDYFPTAVTLEYLGSLLEDFQILDDIELIVHGPDDLLSRPPPGHIMLL